MLTVNVLNISGSPKRSLPRRQNAYLGCASTVARRNIPGAKWRQAVRSELRCHCDRYVSKEIDVPIVESLFNVQETK